MMAFTLWQPWASLVVNKWKPFEFRSWRPPHKFVGLRMAIHAGVRIPPVHEIAALIRLLESSDWKMTGVSRDALPALHEWAAEPRLLPLGFVLGSAVLGAPIRNRQLADAMGVDVVNDSDRVQHTNWGWPMLNVERLDEPVQARGRQGFWTFTGGGIE